LESSLSSSLSPSLHSDSSFDQEEEEEDQEGCILETALLTDIQTKSNLTTIKFKKSNNITKNDETSLIEIKNLKSKPKTPTIKSDRLSPTKEGVQNIKSVRSRRRRMCCCTPKCGCLLLIAIYVGFDAAINLFFVTGAFTHLPVLKPFEIHTTLIDVWLISVLRTLVFIIILTFTAVRHRIIYTFVRKLHKSYITAFLCLIMYSYSMIKMLLHANLRKADRVSMLMFIWNIFGALLFFISWYMLTLLKLKESSNYQKANFENNEQGDGTGEEDIFMETLKETQKKRSSLIRLFAYSKPDWLFILIGTIFLLFGAICEAFVPYYTGQVLHSIILAEDMANFKSNVIRFVLAHFLSNMAGGVRTTMFSITVARLNVRLRALVFKTLIRQDIGFFDKTKTGDMLSRLSADTTTMSDLISQNLNGFLWNLVKTIGTLAFILKLSWQLSLLCFIGAPIVFSVGKLSGSYLKKVSVKVQKFMAEASFVAEESLSTIRTVRSFANEDGELESYRSKIKLMLKQKINQALAFIAYDWTVKIMELCMTSSMLIYGDYLVVTKQISSNDFLSFVIYQLTLSTCLEGLTSVYTGLMNAVGSSEKIFEYLSIKTTLKLDLHSFGEEAVQGAIEFKNVHFAYPTRPDAPILKVNLDQI
jgi:ATP-binding cassette, subfamily B (MDR/TAP), member 9